MCSFNAEPVSSVAGHFTTRMVLLSSPFISFFSLIGLDVFIKLGEQGKARTTLADRTV